MSIFLRKSLRAGPLRFNLSKSGIGVSAGIPGLRIGLLGPRGHYVYMGRGGAYYRKTLGGGGPRSSPADTSPRPRLADLAPISEPLLEDVTGATVVEMASAEPSDLVTQLNASARMTALWPVALAFTALVAAGAFIGLWPIGIVVAVVGLAATWWVRQRDIARRAVVAFYDVNDEPAQRFAALVDGFNALRACERKSRVLAQDATDAYQRKREAGATSLSRIAGVQAGVQGPRFLTTNVAVPSLTDSARATHFLPDRLLIREGSSYAEVDYDALQASAEQVRWIEADAVPGDSRQVDVTWRYVNKSAGPDRRFNDNRQLPIMLYSRLTLSAPNGLREIYQFSNPDAAQRFVHGLQGSRPAARESASPANNDSRKVAYSTGRPWFGIVGEASYQPALRRISAGRRERGEEVSFEVLIQREPDNPHDPNAVQVTVNGVGTVGYFRRDEAPQFQPALKAVEAKGKIVTCQAILIGGDADGYSLGALLDLDADRLLNGTQ